MHIRDSGLGTAAAASFIALTIHDHERKEEIIMKKHLKKLLALLLCATLLCDTVFALSEEIQIQLQEPALEDIDSLDDIEVTLDSAIREQDLTLDNIDALQQETVQDDTYYFQVTGNHSIQTNESHLETRFRDDGFDKVLVDEFGGETTLEEYQFTEDRTAVIVRHLSNSGERELFIPSSVQGYPIVGIGTENCRTFDNIEVLENVSLSEGLKWIGPNVFWGCNRLMTINIPNTVTSIGSYAFIECKALETITLPNSLTSIGIMAFSGSGLKSITIPEGVTSIDRCTFFDCKSLENVSISFGVKEIGEQVFCNCSIKELVIPGSVEVIGDSAFYNCSIKELVIPGSVEVIRDSAFYNCPLVSLTISDGVKRIESYAFIISKDKEQLQSVYIPASVEYIGSNAIGYNTAGMPIEDFVIHGKAGSAAEKYAEENDFEFDDGTVKPRSVRITNGTSLRLYVGNKLKLKTQIKPADAKTTLVWESSDPNVASVSGKGVVTPLKAGRTTVKVTTANGKSARVSIKVLDVKKVAIKEGKSATLTVGKKMTLHAAITPSQVKSKLSWKSSDTKVVTVSSKGVVKCIGKGKAKVTVTTSNGKKATITITVK